MNADSNDSQNLPTFLHAAMCFFGLILILTIGLFVLAVDLHSLLFISLIWSGLNAWTLGNSYHQIRQMMSGAVSRALPAIYIFMLIGMVIASFIQAGTIASLIYYGVDWLSPAFFLAIGLVLCSMMSVATGTSWGTAGTLGVVLIGVGDAMSIPLPLVAGMIVAGATFGDKLSPISDTTNLAAMSAGTSLYRHIGAMLYTTVPSFLLMLLILLVLGQAFTETPMTADALVTLQQALSSTYRLAPAVTLLPLVVMLVLSFRRIQAEVTMTASILAASFIAVVYQGTGISEMLNALWLNSPGTTGFASLDELLGRGGIGSMAWTLLLALMALALGGILHHAGFLTCLLAGVLVKVKRVSALIGATICSGIIGNMAMGEAYISIILNCQLFRQDYEDRKLDTALLSRSVEEGSTLTTGLIPWTTAGAFYSVTLGVPVLDYAPYAFFNYLNGFVAVAMASLGFGLLQSNKVKSLETPH